MFQSRFSSLFVDNFVRVCVHKQDSRERERNCSSGCINCLSWISDSMSFPTALLLLTGSNLSQQIIVNKVSYKDTIVFCQEITTNNKHCRSHNKWSRDGESMSMNGDWTVSSVQWTALQWAACTTENGASYSEHGVTTVNSGSWVCGLRSAWSRTAAYSERMAALYEGG